MTFKVSLQNVLLVAFALGLLACSGGSNNADAVQINTAPVASAITVELIEDQAVETVLPAVDKDKDALTFTVVSQPVNGSVVIVENKATYVPAENFNGSDGFSFKASDNNSDSDVATVTLVVEAVEDAPIAYSVSAFASKGASVEVPLDGKDPDGDALTYMVVDLPSYGSLSAVVGNKITYTPISNHSGEDSFTYLVNDGVMDSDVVSAIIIPQKELNDTGITQCSTGLLCPTPAIGQNLSPQLLEWCSKQCPATDYPNQDAQFGRDIRNNDDSDGHAGFSFTKLDVNGIALPSNATNWSCIKDNVTGLTWEVKKGGNGTMGDEGLNDADDKYSPHEDSDGIPPISYWGGHDGNQRICTVYKANGSCSAEVPACYSYSAASTDSYCNTEAFVDRVNSQGLCGVYDWRMPTIEELRSIVSYDRRQPAIIKDYFPNTESSVYLSSPTYGFSSWGMNFSQGSAYKYTDLHHVRLVRRGQ